MISFVIPAHNEEFLLGRMLTAINKAAREMCEPFEVVVVDDGANPFGSGKGWNCGTVSGGSIPILIRYRRNSSPVAAAA